MKFPRENTNKTIDFDKLIIDYDVITFNKFVIFLIFNKLYRFEYDETVKLKCKDTFEYNL
jgi:hypothetical protein